MRIISGTHRGRIVSPPSGLKLRPTTDLAKESLFNILSNQIDFDDLKVLDLFAGTGNISYEFASRGAVQIVSVEKHPKHVAFIRETIKKMNFEQISIVQADVFKYVVQSKNSAYDLIFADPPYDLPALDSLPNLIFENQVLSNDGVCIIEHPESIDFSQHTNFIELRRYGSVHFSFFAHSQ